MARREFGVELPWLGRVTHLAWADNVYFRGHSSNTVHTMLLEFTTALHASIMEGKPSSLELLHTSKDCIPTLRIQQRGGSVPVEEVAEVNALGSLLSVEKPTCRPVEHRLGKASASFWALADVLTAPGVSLRVQGLRESSPICSFILCWRVGMVAAALLTVKSLGKCVLEVDAWDETRCIRHFCQTRAEVHASSQEVPSQHGVQNNANML